MKRAYALVLALILYAVSAQATEIGEPLNSCSLQTLCSGHPWRCQDCTTCCDPMATNFIPKCSTVCR